ncbi:MAG: adenine methyltransferase [archaeon]|nr:adenine methyltransferase [archaeon]
MKNRNIEHSNNWKTPDWFYNKLDKEFKFDFDPCPYMHDMEWDGLECEWGESNFVNPPYSRKLKESFIKKALIESKKGKTCVLLLPVSTSTIIFHDIILPNKKEIRFIKGRIKFKGYNTKGVYVEKSNGMHDSMIVIFKK